MSPSRQAAPPLLRKRPLIALVALLAMALTAFSAAQAFADDNPPAGSYEGASDAYNGATVSFDIDADGNMSNFNSQSYCYSNGLPITMQWTEMPVTQVEAGVAFDLNWEFESGDMDAYYELTGTVNADGTASGTGRAGFLPYGTCGGAEFEWTAETSGGGDPDPEPVYDPQASFTPSTLTESEMVGNGVTLNASGFPADVDVDIFWVELEAGGPSRTDENGEIVWSGIFDEGVEPGTYTARLTHEDLSVSTSFTVTADPDPEPVYDPQVTVSPSTLTEAEMSDTGVTVAASGFPANVEVAVTQIEGQMGGLVTTDANGEINAPGFFAGGFEPGTYTVGVSYEDLSATATFTVTADEDPEPVYEPTASADPSTLTRAQIGSQGVMLTGAGFPADVNVGFSVGGEGVGSGTARADGSVALLLFTTLDEGTYDVVLTSGDLTASTSFTVTANPAPVYEPTASVDPSSVSESDLASSGVTISGADFPAGATVALTVAGDAAGSQTANAGGGAVSFDYTSSDLGTGTHEVVLTSGDLTASASLTVTEDADPVYYPGVSLSPSEVSESALADAGVTVTGNGFPENAPVTLYVGGDEVAVADSDSNGDVEFTYTSDVLAAGEYTVRLEADAEGASVELTLTVSADEVPAPVTIPGVEPGPEDLTSALEGEIGVPATAAPGDTIAIAVDGVEPGTEVGVWLFSEATYLGTHEVDANGQVTVTIPAGIEPGTHTISVWANDGLVGWDTILIVSAAGDDDPAITDPATDPVDGAGADEDELAVTGGTLSVALVLTMGLLLAFGYVLVVRARSRRSTIA